MEVTLEATEGELAGLQRLRFMKEFRKLRTIDCHSHYGRKSLKITRRWEVQPDAG